MKIRFRNPKTTQIPEVDRLARDYATTIAIDLEEKYQGSICYFDRLPHEKAKKPNRLFLLKEISQSRLVLEAYAQKNSHDIRDLASSVREFINEHEFMHIPRSPQAPMQRLFLIAEQSSDPTVKLCEYLGASIVTSIHPDRRPN